MSELVGPNDPVLRERIPELGTPLATDLSGLAARMFRAMRLGNGISTGCGLAAPQVGERIRMFVLDVREGFRRRQEVCINPVVLQTGKKTSRDRESCLSFPGVSVWVRRPRSITAEWTRLDGARVRDRLEGLEARAFLHELDHLNGLCIVPEQQQVAA